MRALTQIILLLIAALLAVNCLAEPQGVECMAEIFFSPNGDCTEAIAAEIGEAKREILVQAYSFTSVPIAKTREYFGVDRQSKLTGDSEWKRQARAHYESRAFTGLLANNAGEKV